MAKKTINKKTRQQTPDTRTYIYISVYQIKNGSLKKAKKGFSFLVFFVVIKYLYLLDPAIVETLGLTPKDNFVG